MGSAARGVLGDIDPSVLGRAMLDAARAARIGVTVTLVDTTPMRNVYVSEAAADIMGWPVEELLAGDPMEHIASADLPRVRERMAKRQGGETGEASYEVTLVRKDGTEVPIEVTATRATIDGRAAVFTFIIDASARKEVERHRLQTEARFRDLIEIAPELIGIIRDGRFVYANRAYVTALGYASAQELSAVPIADLVEPGEADVQRQRESAILARGEQPPPPHIYRARRKDGTPILLEASSVYFEYEGKPSVLAMARDVTQRKQLERQLIQADRLAALGTMAAGVAHEINNPLAYVMLNLEWISRKLPNVRDDPASLSGLTVMLDEARQGAERVSVIVRELRSFSRSDGETRRPVDPKAVVQSAIKMVGNEIRHRARVITSFEPARPVLANEARLEQVVVNLLLNAAQAMPDGRASNEIRVTVREDPDHRAVLEVFDNGGGIPADVLPRMFDPFFTTKPVGVGTGLGLSICHGIVTSLGGHIGAYSDEEGTTFRVVLPTTETFAADSTPPTSEGPSSRDGIRARVLIVDDELAIGNAMRELLSSEHEVVPVVSANEALAAMLSRDFDVVFCDLMMPGMSGIELYERVRADRPGIEQRIVFMTGGAFTARAAEFLASVSNRRLEKPFSLGLVESLVYEMARSARQGAATR